MAEYFDRWADDIAAETKCFSTDAENIKEAAALIRRLAAENEALRNLKTDAARAVNLCGDPLNEIEAEKLHRWCADHKERTCLSGNAGLAFLDATARLRAREAKLVEALMPFAEAAGNFDKLRITNAEEWFAYGGQSANEGVTGAITVGDLRRARAAIEGSRHD